MWRFIRHLMSLFDPTEVTRKFSDNGYQKNKFVREKAELSIARSFKRAGTRVSDAMKKFENIDAVKERKGLAIDKNDNADPN